MGSEFHRARLSLRLLILPCGCLCAIPAVKADPIDLLVQEVSEQRISNHIAALDFPRNTIASMSIASDYIAGEFAAYGYEVTEQPLNGSENLIARREGSIYPDQVVVVGAHFDTIANTPGADDNASGIAALLEIARVLAGVEPSYSVEFVAFTYEEIGTVGSNYYVQNAVMDGMDIIGMYCFDMIAYTCRDAGCQEPINDVPACFDIEPEGVTAGVYILALVNSASAAMLDTFASAADRYVPGLVVFTATVVGEGDCYFFTRRSDHREFWDAGFKALELYDTYGSRNPFYHTPADSLGTLDLPFCRRVTQATLASLLTSDATAASGAGFTFSGLALHPNPLNPKTRISFILEDPGDVCLSIFDCSGRKLRCLVQGYLEPGQWEFIWRGEDDQGRQLASGVYLIQLEHPGGRAGQKAVLIH